MTTTREINWRDLVQKVEGERYWLENLYPVVYIFSGQERRRDSGPESGIYDKTP